MGDVHGIRRHRRAAARAALVAAAASVALAGAAAAGEGWSTTVRRAPPPPRADVEHDWLIKRIINAVTSRSGLSFRDDREPMRDRRLLMARRILLQDDAMEPYLGGGLVTKKSLRLKGAAGAVLGGVERSFIGSSVLYGEAQQRQGFDGDVETVLWIGLRHRRKAGRSARRVLE